MDDSLKNLQLLLDSDNPADIELAFTLMETMGGKGLILPTKRDVAEYIGMKSPVVRSMASLLVEDAPLSRAVQKTTIYSFWGITDHELELNAGLKKNFPSYLRWMKRLRKLSLQNPNKVRSLGWNFDDGLAHLSNSLVDLVIQGNVLMEVAWYALKKVQFLKISNNRVLTFPTEAGLWQELTSLSVRDCDFDYFRLAAFPKLGGLTIDQNRSEMRLDLSGMHAALNELKITSCSKAIRFVEQPAVFNNLETIDFCRVNLINFPFSPDQMPQLKKVSMNKDMYKSPMMIDFVNKAKQKRIVFYKYMS